MKGSLEGGQVRLQKGEALPCPAAGQGGTDYPGGKVGNG